MPQVMEVDITDTLQPPAGYEAPYKHYREVEAQKRPAVTLEQALALLTTRPDWQTFSPIAARDLPRHPAEKYLAGMTLVLDPGHGGDGMLLNYKRGPTGVREAVANLRVALLLRELLTQAGVNVHLTRDRDNDLSLADRAALAETVEADFFISLHHNAAENADANYTSVWLHDDYAANGPALDLARHTARSITRHLRTDAAYTSPLMSDRQIYESGFGVLRLCKVPAILIESSFHTNPAEEQRLASADHNLREAYAVYEALCEFALAGRPTQTVTGTVDANAGVVRVRARLDTGLPPWWGNEQRGPLPGTITVFADGNRVAESIAYNAETRIVEAGVPVGTQVIELHHENPLGNRNWPQRYTPVSGTGGAVSFRALPPKRIGDERRTEEPVNLETPWLTLPEQSPPFLLHQGGDTAAQELIDSLKLPAGSALTIARIDPATGAIYALRYQEQTRRGLVSTGDKGFDPAGLIALPAALATVRQASNLDPPIPFDSLRMGVGADMQAATALVQDALAGDAGAIGRLLEIAGFAETNVMLQDAGAEKLMIRRRLDGSAETGSRLVTFVSDTATIGQVERPAVEFPLNADTVNPTSDAGRANWASPDDLIRVLALTFLTNFREMDGFETVIDGMTMGTPMIRAGLADLGEFVVIECTDASAAIAYVYDATRDRHYFISVHHHGEPAAAQQGIGDAAKALFTAIRAGTLRL